MDTRRFRFVSMDAALIDDLAWQILCIDCNSGGWVIHGGRCLP